MIEIYTYDDEFLTDLCVLANQHTQSLPPYCKFMEADIKHIVKNGMQLWSHHYPEEAIPKTCRTICALKEKRVVAALQWVELDAGLSIQWFLAEPGNTVAIEACLNQLIDRNRKITFSRFAFGSGWFGLPTVWTHLIETLSSYGFQTLDDSPWLILFGSTISAQISASLPFNKQLDYKWNTNSLSGENHLVVTIDGKVVGKCEAWSLPIHLKGTCAADWSTIEWIEVEQELHGHGIGKAIMSEALRFYHAQGIENVIAWTNKNNIAARKMCEAMGMEYGPELIELALTAS